MDYSINFYRVSKMSDRYRISVAINAKGKWEWECRNSIVCASGLADSHTVALHDGMNHLFEAHKKGDAKE